MDFSWLIAVNWPRFSLGPKHIFKMCLHFYWCIIVTSGNYYHDVQYAGLKQPGTRGKRCTVIFSFCGRENDLAEREQSWVLCRKKSRQCCKQVWCNKIIRPWQTANPNLIAMMSWPMQDISIDLAWKPKVLAPHSIPIEEGILDLSCSEFHKKNEKGVLSACFKLTIFKQELDHCNLLELESMNVLMPWTTNALNPAFSGPASLPCTAWAGEDTDRYSSRTYCKSGWECFGFVASTSFFDHITFTTGGGLQKLQPQSWMLATVGPKQIVRV